MAVIYSLSCSHGKDSNALLLYVLEHPELYPLDEVVYFRTGAEFRCIDDISARIRRMCEERGIRYVVLEPDIPFFEEMLNRAIIKRTTGMQQSGRKWCGGYCRWGTRLKLNAISKYEHRYHQGDFVVEYVGIAADELHRIDRTEYKNKVKIYPLIEQGMTEADCLKYCRDRGFEWTENGIDLYDILDRLSCYCCGNKNLAELRNYYKYLPEYWRLLKDLQHDMPGWNFRKGVSIDELEERFMAEMECVHT